MPAPRQRVVDACLSDALSLTREWMPRWLDHVHGALREREASASSLFDKQALVAARVALEGDRDRVATQYLVSLAEALHVGERNPAAVSMPLSFDELELMGDEQVQETVELARVQQVVKMAVEDHEAELTALLCSAQGLPQVSTEANPLRTEVFVRALMSAFKRLQIDPAVRSRWLQAGAVALGSELSAMTARLADSLQRHGVAPASYVVVQSPTSRMSPLMTRAESVPLDTGRSPDALLTIDHLHQLLVGNLDAGPAGNETAGMVRSLAGEVVSLMLQRISSDERLLAPVREMLMGMKPALLELARTEPRFFADRHNPARRLLDGITECSLAFTSELDDGYADFARELRQIVQALQAPGGDLAERFPALLIRLMRYQSDMVAPDQIRARGLAMQTLVRVEQRKLLAERVASEIKARNDFGKAPGVVRRFLTGPWSQVVAQARLDASERPPAVPGESSAMRYSDVLPDLLWSSQLALASQNRPRLVKIIPGVLRTLREGLDSIDYPREQAESFFQALMGLHEAAYKTNRQESPADGVVSRHNEEDAELWMQRQEARDTNFLHGDAEESTQPAFADTQPMQRDWSEVKADMAARNAIQFTVGSWFDMWQDGLALRCQLTWASPHGTLFLFTTSNGRSMSLTRRSLDRLVEQNRLLLVSGQGVVDEALDAVAQQALLNSGRSN